MSLSWNCLVYCLLEALWYLCLPTNRTKYNATSVRSLIALFCSAVSEARIFIYLGTTSGNTSFGSTGGSFWLNPSRICWIPIGYFPCASVRGFCFESSLSIVEIFQSTTTTVPMRTAFLLGEISPCKTYWQ